MRFLGIPEASRRRLLPVTQGAGPKDAIALEAAHHFLPAGLGPQIAHPFRSPPPSLAWIPARVNPGPFFWETPGSPIPSRAGLVGWGWSVLTAPARRAILVGSLAACPVAAVGRLAKLPRIPVAQGLASRALFRDWGSDRCRLSCRHPDTQAASGEERHQYKTFPAYKTFSVSNYENFLRQVP
jgi:hypothetical protein